MTTEFSCRGHALLRMPGEGDMAGTVQLVTDLHDLQGVAALESYDMLMIAGDMLCVSIDSYSVPYSYSEKFLGALEVFLGKHGAAGAVFEYRLGADEWRVEALGPTTYDRWLAHEAYLIDKVEEAQDARRVWREDNPMPISLRKAKS